MHCETRSKPWILIHLICQAIFQSDIASPCSVDNRIHRISLHNRLCSLWPKLCSFTANQCHLFTQSPFLKCQFKVQSNSPHSPNHDNLLLLACNTVNCTYHLVLVPTHKSIVKYSHYSSKYSVVSTKNTEVPMLNVNTHYYSASDTQCQVQQSTQTHIILIYSTQYWGIKSRLLKVLNPKYSFIQWLTS